MVWYLYGLCSYFVHTVLIPIVFPLIISQTVPYPPEPHQGWLRSHKDLKCKQNEMQLTHSFSTYPRHSFDPPRLRPLPTAHSRCSHGHRSPLLPAGRLFPKIVDLSAIYRRHCSGKHHSRRGPCPPPRPNDPRIHRLDNSQTPILKQAIFRKLAITLLNSSRLLRSCNHGFFHISYVQPFGPFHRYVGRFDIQWPEMGRGMVHIFSTNRATASFTDSESNSFPITHVISIFRYPHAAGSLAGVFLSEHFVSISDILHGPFAFSSAAHPLQQVMKLDAEKMQLLGFILSTFTSGFGFYYHGTIWNKNHMLLFAAIQGTATGLLHAFGRVLWLDCSPAGKEGAFSVWFSWARALGACAGFALATAIPGNVGRAFGVSFCAGIVGMVVLIFGNISSLRGAKAAGHVIKSENASPVHGLDDDYSKGSVTTEVLPKGKVEV
ncbi:hypothetical protein DH2020_029022 [Rehmannia glutinosa]|uniref:Uncharacterized protein n=1 Tax=Rehmannia glutinosa TaxID=99300 RepID=A0ABR0VPS0_REHGL